MQDFDLSNSTGDMFLEPRTDGGIGVFAVPSPTRTTVALSKEEFLKMAAWVVAYADTMRSK